MIKLFHCIFFFKSNIFFLPVNTEWLMMHFAYEVLTEPSILEYNNNDNYGQS